MKLMRLCGHDRCSAHWILDPEDERGGEMCQGGVFLPDDTLVVEKVDGDWPAWALVAATEGWYAGSPSKQARFVLDALSVREST